MDNVYGLYASGDSTGQLCRNNMWWFRMTSDLVRELVKSVRQFRQVIEHNIKQQRGRTSSSTVFVIS
jgi:hypothetical protein